MDANDLSSLSASTDVLSDTYKLEIPLSADIYDVINHPQHYEAGGIECFPRESSRVDVVNHPPHYETGRFECIDVILETQGAEATRDFCICNALKYIYRHRRKNGDEDLRKAQWYLNKYFELGGAPVEQV